MIKLKLNFSEIIDNIYTPKILLECLFPYLSTRTILNCFKHDAKIFLARNRLNKVIKGEDKTLEKRDKKNIISGPVVTYEFNFLRTLRTTFSSNSV